MQATLKKRRDNHAIIHKNNGLCKVIARRAAGLTLFQRANGFPTEISGAVCTLKRQSNPLKFQASIPLFQLVQLSIAVGDNQQVSCPILTEGCDRYPRIQELNLCAVSSFAREGPDPSADEVAKDVL